MTQLPIFVYGTLRHGQSNYSPFLAGKTQREHPAILPNHALYTALYPYVLDTGDGGQVYGELMFPLADIYGELLARLDALEGYREGDESSEYLRVRRHVRYTDAGGETLTVAAWVYHAGAAIRRQTTEQARIRGGDWLAPEEA